MRGFVSVGVGVLLFIVYIAWQSDDASPSIYRLSTRTNGEQEKIYVHMDLKGAAPKMSYYSSFFVLLQSIGVDGVLMEYEDMFPFEGLLATIPQTNAYSRDEISEINRLARESKLEVIPLVQTFGHMEYVLKRPLFCNLSENPFELNSICPSDDRTLPLITEMLKQIHTMHPNSYRVHIGSDEVYHAGEDFRCKRKLVGKKEDAVERLKLAHIASVARIARGFFDDVLSWNDMFQSTPSQILTELQFPSLLSPVVWGYSVDVLTPGYFPDGIFNRYQVFPNLWFASAFKGANGINQSFINMDRYLQNQRSYTRLRKKFSKELFGRVRGMIITGWQRYYHNMPLCELLPVAIPSLVADVLYLRNSSQTDDERISRVKTILSCSQASPSMLAPRKFSNETYFPTPELEFVTCNFTGSKIYNVIMDDLRFLTWKVHRFSKIGVFRQQLFEDVSSTMLKVSNALSDVYDNDTEMKLRLDVDHKRDSFEEEEQLLEDDGDVPDSFNQWPHIFNLANCIVGVSILAMPFVFQECGIVLATLAIGLCALLTKFTCHFLAVASFTARRHSYEALAHVALGPYGRRVCEMFLLFFLVSSITAFMVVIGDIGPHVVADYLDLEAPTQKLRTLVMVLVLLFVIFPLSCIKDLQNFSLFSSIAVVFYAAFALRMIAESVPVIYDGRWSIHVYWFRPSGFLTCIPIICMAMSCQTQLFCVTECIKEPTTAKVDSIISGAVNFCSAMYAAIGLFGYVAFHSKELHGDVLVELGSSFFTQVLKLAFMLSVAISIPLMLFPARTAFFNLFLRPTGSELTLSSIRNSTFHVLNLVILLSNMVVAIIIPNVEFILGITGSLVGSLVSTILPSVFFLSIMSRSKVRTKYKTAAKICLILGAFILVTSTWATLQVERKSTVVEKPKAKDILDEPAIKSLERLEEQLLDSNTNISQKLADMLAVETKDRDTAKLLVEIQEHNKQHIKLIERQEKIVDQLKHSHNDQVKINENKRDVSVEQSSKSTSL